MLLRREYLLDGSEIERAERDIYNTVGAEDNHETNQSPENSALPFYSFRLFTRMSNEFEYTPQEHDERGCCEKQNNRVDYLRDNFAKKLIENSHSS